MPKTTNEHLAVFKKECERLIEKIGLHGWQDYYELSDEIVGASTATCESFVADRMVVFRLSSELFEDELTEEALLDHAMHEILELLLARMHALMLSRYVEPEEADEARHEVIHILRRLLKGVVLC